jgi:hypothetical protein
LNEIKKARGSAIPSLGKGRKGVLEGMKKEESC